MVEYLMIYTMWSWCWHYFYQVNLIFNIRFYIRSQNMTKYLSRLKFYRYFRDLLWWWDRHDRILRWIYLGGYQRSLRKTLLWQLKWLLYQKIQRSDEDSNASTSHILFQKLMFANKGQVLLLVKQYVPSSISVGT